MGHYSDPHLIYLDFDFSQPWKRSPHLRPIFTVLRIVGLNFDERFGLCLERTRHGWHVIFRVLEKLTPAEQVALQSCCGSDGRREALNLMRALAIARNRVTPYWRERWNILFMGKLK